MTDTTLEVVPEIEEPKKKKRVNSKKKGSGFEGQISKILGAALLPMQFRRSQSSGAILGGKNSKFMEQFSSDAKALFIGDVVPTNESDVFRDEGWKFKFTLECKFYRNCDTLDHLFGNTKIKLWFEQAYTDSLKLGKEPLLIFKFNHTETFCATNFKTLDRLPKTVKSCMLMTFPDGRSINIYLLKDALLDLDWWKTTKIPTWPNNVLGESSVLQS